MQRVVKSKFYKHRAEIDRVVKFNILLLQNRKLLNLAFISVSFSDFIQLFKEYC